MKILKNIVFLLSASILLTLSSTLTAKPININGYTQLYPYTIYLMPNVNSAYRTEVKVLLPGGVEYKEEASGTYIDAVINGMALSKKGEVHAEFPIKYATTYHIITSGVGSLITVEKLKKLETIESLKEDWRPFIEKESDFLVQKKKGSLISENDNSFVYKYEFKQSVKTYTRFLKVITKDDVKITIIGDYDHFSPLGNVTLATDLLTKIFEKISIVE